MNSVKPTILCVDDEVDNLDALERLFRKKYTVFKASSGAKALDVIQKNSDTLCLILTDQRMPEMTGIELLEKTIHINSDIIRMLITGFTDLESVILAVNKGQIYKYITKPWDPVDLLNTVDRAIERFIIGKELTKKSIELEKAYNELKTLDEAKSKFMILINHELKTPLTSIINFLALLKETNLNSDQVLYIDRMNRSADKLKQIIDDVLIIMKSETNQLTIEPQSMMLSSIKTFLWPDNTQLMEKKHISLNENIDPLEFKADKKLFIQILNRILNNALKFSSEKATVEIKGSKIGNFYEFKIFNPGSTIPEEALDKIFKPFYLEENIMNHSIGIGLGLSICEKLLKLHNSSLNIKNLDHGVQVSFYFPLVSI